MKARGAPATIGMVDVETSELAGGEIPRTKFWGLALDGRYRRFKTSRGLFRHLATRTDPAILYCHHDYDIVQSLVDGQRIDIEEVRGGRILRARCAGAEWRNSYALVPARAAEILETCGFEKPGLDSLEERNRADTVDMLEALRMIAEKYRQCWSIYPLGGPYLTAASVSFAAAENAAGKLPIWLNDRGAYRGGRTEAFRVGPCGEADLYDINSSYPYAITDAPARDKLYYMDVDVEGDGPMPFFHLTDSRQKLIFPAGRFRTAVWESNYERYIAPFGGIRGVKVKKVIHCDFGWLVRLKELVTHAYGERMEAKKRGDTVLAFATKIGLNSIYGRLGMKAIREVVNYSDSVPSPGNATEGVHYYPMPDGRNLSFKTMLTKPRANYLFASFITCNARARLYAALRSVESPFYCDTDSIYVPHGADFPLDQGKALGQWKPEAGPHKLTVTSLKDYRYGNEWKRKGGRGGFTWTPRRALSGQTVKVTKKTRRSEYDKRTVIPGGGTVPVILSEW